MTVYTVHARGTVSPEADPLSVVFVKEGFAWPALFFAVPWMLFRAMWLVLVLYLVAVAGFYFLGRVIPPSAMSAVAVLFAFLFALEANELRRWKLSRRGFRMVGVAEGHGRSEAELRFFASLPAPAPIVAERKPTQPVADQGGPAVIGLFPAPGAGS
jgi:hypothetical protein